ncbi:family 16 glycoside hydrolase [Glaciecola sp. 1036]|uniref:family 16 glycoside hydrolase n=1 Tax=Alteromonadaceae TaxID=72275 RepID=UPI003D08AFA3
MLKLSLKARNKFLVGITALACLGNAFAAGTDSPDEVEYFDQSKFRASDYWKSADQLSNLPWNLSYQGSDAENVLVTTSTVNSPLEDTSSQIMTAGQYADMVLQFEFLLQPESEIDVLPMGRYGIRFSSKQKAKGVLASGAVAASWDEFDASNPERLFGGFSPIEETQLAANTWHKVEVRFRAPRYDEAHNKVGDAFILSVSLNDKLVQKNILVSLPSKNARWHWEGESGPVAFDLISGQAALRSVLVSRADFSRLSLPSESRADNNEAELVDLIAEGKTAFAQYGCIECHSIKKADPSVKTGPNLYGLFAMEPRKRWVQNQEGHLYEVRADKNYLERSIRSADAELAIAESGAKEGEPYLPIMPRYNQEIIPDKNISAIYAYLKTRQDVDKQGPVVQLEDATGPVEYDPMQDPMQFVVQERIRIQRGPMADLSGRAIHVGHPNGIHYAFDPRNLSVSKVWQGGFLETSGELTGRGGKGFKIGYAAVEANIGEMDALLQPINAAGNKIDFSFKSPKFGDQETLLASTHSPLSLEERTAQQDAQFKGYYRDSTQPLSPVSFFYSVGQNDVAISHSFSQQGKLTIQVLGNFKQGQEFAVNQFGLTNIEVSKGTIKDGIWTLPANSKTNAKLVANITLVDTPWLATDTKFNYEQQAFEKRDGEADLPPGYSIEDWLAPSDNAGREQLFEAIGLDTAANGDLLVSTRTAGVWRKRGDKWMLFGEGIFDSLGILSESEDGSVAVVGNKAELTRIKDVNGDGIADFYDTLFDNFTNGSNYHSYTHGPIRDGQGNYLITLNLGHGGGIPYTAGGNVMGTHGGYLGWAFKISPDGAFETFANGLRSPAGLGIDPDGNLWYADNQGDFVGSSKIYLLEKGAFYGHPAGLIDEADMTPDSPEIQWQNVIERKARAAIVVAHARVANSLGNLGWDTTDGKFGQFSGQGFIGDQTQSNLSRVTFEKVNGTWQGAMLPFASGMASGVMKPLFLSDGSMLLGQTGRGWHAKGGNAAALQHVVYDGKATYLAIDEVHITNDGFRLSFTQSLPKGLENTPIEKWLNIESWTYRDAPDYGSDELGLMQDKIAEVNIDSDRKALTLRLETPEIPQVHPQQTGRIYHILLANPALEKASANRAIEAYYSAQGFKQ